MPWKSGVQAQAAGLQHPAGDLLSPPTPPFLPPPKASSELGDDVQLHSLMGRIALLVLHFPRLRLIWSRSLHATADMFQQLKGNQEEPDPVAGEGPGWGGGGRGRIGHRMGTPF